MRVELCLAPHLKQQKKNEGGKAERGRRGSIPGRMNRNKGTVTYTSRQNELMTSAKH